jgi:hypothetical protein
MVTMEETASYMVAPTTNGEKPLPRRGGPKGMLPSTWLNRSLRVEYTDASGRGQATTATLLDCYPAGPILNVGGGKTLISWDRLVLAELVEDR